MKNKIANAFIFSLFFSANFAVFGEKFQIQNVEYELENTKQYALEKKVDISQKKIFKNQDEFEKYLDDLRQKFKNQRIFSSTEVNYTLSDFDEDSDIQYVNLKIKATDSKHFVLVPYPKYDSNDGAVLKLKLEDSNFLGTMNKLSSDISIGTKDGDFSAGFEFKYDYPFKLGILNANWCNDFEGSYNFGNSSSEFDLNTGLSFELPFDSYSLVFDITQSLVKDYDYTKFNDELYSQTDAKLSMPIKIAEINDWGNVDWAPFIECRIDYDKNGIDYENQDLTNPVLTFGHAFFTKRINWYGNFRNGALLSFSQSVGYDFQRNEYQPKIRGELQAFKAFNFAGVALKSIIFASMNTSQKIGKNIRGILDDQFYNDSDERALKVSSAIVMNLDFPIHIITTDWTSWTQAIFGEDSWINRHFQWLKHLNFEMQISPFVDIALTKNKITGKCFSVSDGWYASGIEVLVYPARWRSLVVRASAGFDLGQLILSKKAQNYYDSSWRSSDVSSHEFYVGIGLHY
ncbi:hypothetical protein [Treponema zioleckii]|uniref:hypothetical protein n=1 Tax=Treponema zioleckii TaxID=331680 RepID=UPI00168B69C9|nr:hypothetical protein [Treponema zioleckii]